MKQPNLFIVGAPKCGTSAMFNYLIQHPDIYGAAVKEPCYFGADLKRKSIKKYQDISEYEELYGDVSKEIIIGEASTWYLYSTLAAKEIKNNYPNSKIIIMLRNPVDTMYSLHGQLVKTGDEDILNFKEALDAEKVRKQGDMIPDRVSIVQSLFYSDVVRYAEQVERYFHQFGKEKCKVILFDDFVKNTLAVYQDTLNFLNLNSDFIPEIKIVNQGKQVKNMWLHNIAIKPSVTLVRLKKILPDSLRKLLGEILHSLNSRRGGRLPLENKYRRKLSACYVDEVKQLGKLIGKDLTNWSR